MTNRENTGLEGSRKVPARRLRVLVGSMRIEDGLAPPAVGEVGTLMLDFIETGPASAHDLADPAVSVLRARAAPAGDGSPRGGGQRWDGTPDATPVSWPTVLHGDGWSATWSAPRPVVGHVELIGRLIDNLDGGSRAETRGRFTRVRVATKTAGRNRQDLRDVAVSPRWFDNGTVVPAVSPTEAPAGGFVFVSPVPADPWVREVGVLVDFDLDDVAPVPPRPRVVPGALAAHGPDLWVLDERLPLLLRVRRALAEQPEITEYTWPGRILTEHETAPRALHPDADGCWITGPDGLLRAHPDTGDVVAVDTRTTNALVHGAVFARIVTDDGDRTPRLRRWTYDGPPIEDADLGEGDVHGLVATIDGGHLALRGHPTNRSGAPLASRPAWLTAVGPDGTVTHGPSADVAGTLHAPLLPSAPPVVDDSRAHPGGLRRVRPDPSISAPTESRMLLRGYATDGRLWVLTHPPHPDDIARHGTAACWPLAAPPVYLDDRQHWLLTELDPTTHQPLMSHLVPDLPSDLAATDDGAVWVLADGLRHLPPHDGATAQPPELEPLATPATNTTGTPT